jgi:hypothetical protein
LSSGKFGRSHQPKVIAWKEPVENDDDYLSDVGPEPDPDPDPTVQKPSTNQSIDQEESPKLLNPKKKWLREAWNDDLGTKPLEPDVNNLFPESHWQMGGQRQIDDNPNQMRPTVLMVASRDQTRPLLEGASGDPVEQGETRYQYGGTGTRFEGQGYREHGEQAYYNDGRTMSILEISPELIRSVRLKDQSILESSLDQQNYQQPQHQYYETGLAEQSHSYLNPRPEPKHHTHQTENPQEYPFPDYQQPQPDSYNRELFGALALIQLATDDLAVDYSVNRNQPDNYVNANPNAIVSEDDTILTEEEEEDSYR